MPTRFCVSMGREDVFRDGSRGASESRLITISSAVTLASTPKNSRFNRLLSISSPKKVTGSVLGFNYIRENHGMAFESLAEVAAQRFAHLFLKFCWVRTRFPVNLAKSR